MSRAISCILSLRPMAVTFPRQERGSAVGRIFVWRFIVAQTRQGALTASAGRRGMSVEEYQAKLSDGFAWCTECRSWHMLTEFGRDATRYNGIATQCRASRKRRYDRTYTPKGRTSTKGRRYKPVRDGDQIQAAKRIGHLVETGTLPHANTQPCAHCGHERTSTSLRRHEYHHHKGYAAIHHEDVIPLCSSCHRIANKRRAR